MRRPALFFFIFLFCSSLCESVEWSCRERPERLMDDLMIVEYWNCRLCQRLPVHYNHLLQGGYFQMPSARMGGEGELGGGYAYVPPYRLYNLRCQLASHLEISGNYRVFKGVPDPILTPLGFGDLSDKGANFKLALIRPEDSDYELPGLAFGMEDFLGTRAFKSYYFVLTQVFLEPGLEWSVGWGGHHIRGFFGGLSWMPFHQCKDKLLRGLLFAAEYDATPYHDENIEPHPEGRVQKSPINFGLKYRLWDIFDFSLSYIRGEALAFSAAASYNFGTTKGFIPKIEDPLPYIAPVNREPVGCSRPESTLAAELIYAFEEQGFDILDLKLCRESCGRTLRLSLYNNNYRLERDVRRRLDYLLAGTVPENIDRVTVVIESEGFPIQEYHYCMPFVRRFGERCMGGGELAVISPMTEVTRVDKWQCCTLFHKDRRWFCPYILPDFHSFFGSSRGKFKYALGTVFGANGYLPCNLYYSAQFSYLFLSDIDDMKDVDRLNPSQIINVHSDMAKYLKQRGVVFPELYLEKIWNLGCGAYSRLSGGLFQREYGGVGGEFLYYPVHSCWAFGVEGAVLWKRTVGGVGFTNRVRRLDGFVPSYVPFLGVQYFANLYYDWQSTNMEFRFKAGEFLARDFGLRTEISRYFESGLRITLWYTVTNGHDKINGETYFDKGAMISMPLDIFYMRSCRKRWKYGMSAWLRDVGYSASTGRELYNLINENRQN